MSAWSFRFVLFYLLVVFTQPHFRFQQLIPLRLGDLTIGLGVLLHLFDAISKGKKILRLTPVTKVCLAIMALSITSHHLNINAANYDWNPLIDSIVKACIIMIVLDAQTFSIYRATAITAVLSVGTLWWLKGGVRLAQAGVTWSSTTDRLSGANVSMIQNPNDFAYLVAFFLPAYFLFFQLSKSVYTKLACLACFGAGLFIILETGSRTGFLCLCLVMIFYLRVFLTRYRGFFLSSVTALVFLVGLAAFGLPGLVSKRNLDRFTNMGKLVVEIFDPAKAEIKTVAEQEDADSGRIRWKKARSTFIMLLDYPLMGVGTNPRKTTFNPYPNHYLLWGMVHTEFLVAGRIMGFPGVVLYFITLWLPFSWSRQVCRMSRGLWPQLHDVAFALQCQTLVILVGGLFSPSVFNFAHMSLLVVSGAIYRVAREQAVDWQPVAELPANLRPTYA